MKRIGTFEEFINESFSTGIEDVKFSYDTMKFDKSLEQRQKAYQMKVFSDVKAKVRPTNWVALSTGNGIFFGIDTDDKKTAEAMLKELLKITKTEGGIIEYEPHDAEDKQNYYLALVCYPSDLNMATNVKLK